MSVRKRTWKTSAGEERQAWLCDYTGQSGKRHVKTFARKKDADAFIAKAKVEVREGVHTADSDSVTIADAAGLWLATGAARGLERATLAADTKPKEPQPWDRRPWPKQGDKILSKTYAAAGRALSQWERYEGVLSLVFSTFVAGTETQAAKRAYVAVRTFEARADMLRAASLAYFTEKPSDQNLQEPFKTILRDATCFGPRRNEIAHGVVDFYLPENAKYPVPLPEKLPEEAEYALYPSFASFKERSLTNAPTYCYTSAELNYFSGNYVLDNGNEMAESVERQAGVEELELEVEVTPQMLEAGKYALFPSEVLPWYKEEEVLAKIYRAMAMAQAHS